MLGMKVEALEVVVTSGMFVDRVELSGLSVDREEVSGFCVVVVLVDGLYAAPEMYEENS